MVRKKDLPIKFGMTGLFAFFITFFPIYPTYGGPHAKHTP